MELSSRCFFACLLYLFTLITSCSTLARPRIDSTVSSLDASFASAADTRHDSFSNSNGFNHSHLSFPDILRPYTLSLQSISPWEFERNFEFVGPWDEEDTNYVRHSMLGAVTMLSTTIRIIDGQAQAYPPPGLSDPSFLRYFNPNDFYAFRAVLWRLLQVLTPNSVWPQQCPELFVETKLQLVYGDKVNQAKCVIAEEYIDAYVSSNANANGIKQYSVYFCPQYFDDYRSWLHVDKEKLGRTIDNADYSMTSEVETGASTVLHELFHWDALVFPLLLNKVTDLSVIRPDNKRPYEAYRAFYAMHVKDWYGPGGLQSPLLNADTYTFCILEFYYRDLFKLPPWLDPPDPGPIMPKRALSQCSSRNTINPSDSRSYTTNSLSVDVRQVDGSPLWEFEDYFEWAGVWLENDKNIVRYSMLGILEFLSVTLGELNGDPSDDTPPGLTNPSFLRYFDAGDFTTFINVLRRVSAILGASNEDQTRQCITIYDKLQLFTGDPPASGLTKCHDPNAEAYFYEYKDDVNDVWRDYISFCHPVFAEYRSWQTFVQQDMLGDSIDAGNPAIFPEVSTTAVTIFHELLHWPEPYTGVLDSDIVDLPVVRPDTGETWPGYRAFYSMHVKDWGKERIPLRNADCYVYTVLEIYYRKKFDLPPWQDPPDPSDYRPSTEFANPGSPNPVRASLPRYLRSTTGSSDSRSVLAKTSTVAIGQVDGVLKDASSLNFQVNSEHALPGPTPWQFDRNFEFEGYWDLNDMNFVRHSLLGVISMIISTLNTLYGQTGLPPYPGLSDPSFLRYFNAGDFYLFGAVLKRLLEVLLPTGNALPQCCRETTATRLQLMYGDGPTGHDCLATWLSEDPVNAYVRTYKDENNVYREYVSFCPVFFSSYRSWLDIQRDELGRSIDDATSAFPEVDSATSTLLHELFHWHSVIYPVLSQYIYDLEVERPDDGQMYPAYGAFYAMHVKDWDGPNNVRQSPLANADTWTYCILEIFYRGRFQLPPWQDPVDPLSPRSPRSFQPLLHKSGNDVAELNESRSFAANISSVSIRQVDDFPPWQFDDHFVWSGPWEENYQNMIRNSLLGVMDLLTVATTVIDRDLSESTPPESTNPSFLRYFEPEHFGKFRNVLRLASAFVGTPNEDALRQCVIQDIPKIQLFYGDGAGTGFYRCQTTNDNAYFVNWRDRVTREWHDAICFCPQLLHNFRSWQSVRREKLGASIDSGNPAEPCEAKTTTAIVLHELLHYELLYKNVLGQQIDDLMVWRPGVYQGIKAYRAFWAMHVKDWSGMRSPLLNADSYVYTVLEVYYREKFQLPPWEDPPDPKNWQPPADPVDPVDEDDYVSDQDPADPDSSNPAEVPPDLSSSRYIRSLSHGSSDSINELAELQPSLGSALILINRQGPGSTPWQWEDQFESMGIWSENKKNMILHSMLGVLEMVQTTLLLLSGQSYEDAPPIPTDPSFLRYFEADDFATFGKVLGRILAVLGAPFAAKLRECLVVTKLQLYDGDSPYETYCAKDPTQIAYHAEYTTEINGNKIRRSYLAFCRPTFLTYRRWDLVQREDLGQSIDIRNPLIYGPAATTAAVVFHEMLHWRFLFRGLLPRQIIDVPLVRPATGAKLRAYRSFYAMHVKDWAVDPNDTPIYNVDSYVYTVLEIYYRNKFNLPPWQDSPDPRGYVQGQDSG